MVAKLRSWQGGGHGGCRHGSSVADPSGPSQLPWESLEINKAFHAQVAAPCNTQTMYSGIGVNTDYGRKENPRSLEGKRHPNLGGSTAWRLLVILAVEMGILARWAGLAA